MLGIMYTIEQIDQQEELCAGRGGHAQRVNRFMSKDSPQYAATIEQATKQDDAWHNMHEMLRANAAERKQNR